MHVVYISLNSTKLLLLLTGLIITALNSTRGSMNIIFYH